MLTHRKSGKRAPNVGTIVGTDAVHQKIIKQYQSVIMVKWRLWRDSNPRPRIRNYEAGRLEGYPSASRNVPADSYKPYKYVVFNLMPCQDMSQVILDRPPLLMPH